MKEEIQEKDKNLLRKLNKTMRNINKQHLEEINKTDNISYYDFLMSFNPEKHKVSEHPYLSQDFNIENTLSKISEEEKINQQQIYQIPKTEMSAVEKKLSTKKFDNKPKMQDKRSSEETYISNKILFEQEQKENTFNLNNSLISEIKVKNVSEEEKSNNLKNNSPIKKQKQSNILISQNVPVTENTIHGNISVLLSIGNKNVVIDTNHISQCNLTPNEKTLVLEIYKICKKFESNE